MNIAAIIPARYHSTRFEGKPLTLIGGIPMIQRVYQQVQKSGKFKHIIVATDDQRIFKTVQSFGGTVEMTSPDHSSGSERLWEIMESHPFDAAINIQGDEPVVSEKLVRDMYVCLETGEYPVVTPVYFNRSWEDFNNPNVVKAVVGNNGQALYFSRSPVPHVEENKFEGFFQHIGMYGYLRDALAQFVKLPKAKLEALERLEQLRFLENGIPIQVITSQHPSIGVDVPEDVGKIERMLEKQK